MPTHPPGRSKAPQSDELRAGEPRPSAERVRAMGIVLNRFGVVEF